MSLPELFQAMQTANAALAKVTRQALRKGGLPPSRTSTEYVNARAAYRAFWDAPGADAYAKEMAAQGKL